MPTEYSQQVMNDCARYSKALFKFISRNDVGLTGSHQCGYYLPKKPWKLFSPFAPTKGKNFTQDVNIGWPDGTNTISHIKWYGAGTRSEYRLTSFGKGFSWLTEEYIGALLILVIKDHANFIAHVLSDEEEINDLRELLGVKIGESWGVWQAADVVEQ